MIRQYQSFWANDCLDLDNRLNELSRTQGDLKLESLQPNATSGDILVVVSFWAKENELGACPFCHEPVRRQHERRPWGETLWAHWDCLDRSR